MQHLFVIITCDHSKYHPGSIACSLMEDSIGLKRVKCMLKQAKQAVIMLLFMHSLLLGRYMCEFCDDYIEDLT